MRFACGNDVSLVCEPVRKILKYFLKRRGLAIWSIWSGQWKCFLRGGLGNLWVLIKTGLYKLLKSDIRNKNIYIDEEIRKKFLRSRERDHLFYHFHLNEVISRITIHISTADWVRSTEWYSDCHILKNNVTDACFSRAYIFITAIVWP